MLKDGIQGSENVFCISPFPISKAHVSPTPGTSISAVSPNVATVMASAKYFIASGFSRGKKAIARAPIVGRKTIRLNSTA